jgi:hypothetical protein
MVNLTSLRISIVILAALALSACTGALIGLIPNEDPVSEFTATPSEGGEPLTVTFDGSLSEDSDGTVVKYEWDYQGDGTFDATLTTPGTTFVYHGPPGTEFDPVLRVTDNDGATATSTQHILLNSNM